MPQTFIVILYLILFNNQNNPAAESLCHILTAKLQLFFQNAHFIYIFIVFQIIAIRLLQGYRPFGLRS